MDLNMPSIKWFVIFVCLVVELVRSQTDSIVGGNIPGLTTADVSHDEILKKHYLVNSAYPPVFNKRELLDDSVQFHNVSLENSLLELLRVNSSCALDLKIILENLNSLWALSLVDADGKLPSGLLRGNFLWMGDFDECVKTHSPLNASRSFNGQYCHGQWQVSVPSSFNLSSLPLITGICIPDSCNASLIDEDVKAVINYLAQLPFVKKYASRLKLTGFSCALPPSDKVHTKWDIALLLLFLLGFPLIGTCCHLCKYIRQQRRLILRHREQQAVHMHNIQEGENHGELCNGHARHPGEDELPGSALSASTKMLVDNFSLFSLYYNAQKLFLVKFKKSDLQCFHGIKVLSMFWIMLGHLYIHIVPVTDNVAYLADQSTYFLFQIVIQATFAVDSFFLMAGTLLSIYYMRRKRKRNISCFDAFYANIQIVIHRLLRMYMPLLLIMIFIRFCFDHIKSGIFWDVVTGYEKCSAVSSALILVYANNFLSIKNMCAVYTWFLANEMQFFLIGLFIMHWLMTSHRIGLGMAIGLAIISWITTGLISHFYKLAPFFIDVNSIRNVTEYEDQLYRSWDLIYSKPWTRIGPYLIGLVLGYFIQITGEHRSFLSKKCVIMGWTSSAIIMGCVIFGLYSLENYYQWIFDIYNALARSLFSTCLAWMIYACVTGHGGFVDHFLSNALWVPLSRMTYSVYLVHPLVMSWYFKVLSKTFHFTHLQMAMTYLSLVCTSYFFAFILYVCVESPYIVVRNKVEKMKRQQQNNN